MNPIAAGIAGALISGVVMYTAGAKAAQVDAFTQPAPASVETTSPHFVPATYTTTLRPVNAASVPTITQVHNTQRAPLPQRASLPQPRANRTVRNDRQIVRDDDRSNREVVRDEDVQPERSWGKTAMIVGGSAASGAGIGAVLGGGKGAMVGAAIGGGAASIYEATQRR